MLQYACVAGSEHHVAAGLTFGTIYSGHLHVLFECHALNKVEQLGRAVRGGPPGVEEFIAYVRNIAQTIGAHTQRLSLEGPGGIVVDVRTQLPGQLQVHGPGQLLQATGSESHPGIHHQGESRDENNCYAQAFGHGFTAV